MVFYALITASATISLINGLAYSIYPSMYLNLYKPEVMSVSTIELIMRLIWHAESSIIYALITAVTCMMYHLYLTLTFIFDGADKINASEVQCKDKKMGKLGISMVVMYFLIGLIAILLEQ